MRKAHTEETLNYGFDGFGRSREPNIIRAFEKLVVLQNWGNLYALVARPGDLSKTYCVEMSKLVYDEN